MLKLFLMALGIAVSGCGHSEEDTIPTQSPTASASSTSSVELPTLAIPTSAPVSSPIPIVEISPSPTPSASPNICTFDNDGRDGQSIDTSFPRGYPLVVVGSVTCSKTGPVDMASDFQAQLLAWCPVSWVNRTLQNCAIYPVAINNGVLEVGILLNYKINSQPMNSLSMWQPYTETLPQ